MNVLKNTVICKATECSDNSKTFSIIVLCNAYGVHHQHIIIFVNLRKAIKTVQAETSVSSQSDLEIVAVHKTEVQDALSISVGYEVARSVESENLKLCTHELTNIYANVRSNECTRTCSISAKNFNFLKQQQNKIYCRFLTMRE